MDRSKIQGIRWKASWLISLLVLSGTALSGQVPSDNDYNIYSEMIKGDIQKNERSATVIAKGDAEEIGWLRNAIESNDTAGIKLMTRYLHGETSERFPDSADRVLLLKFCNDKSKETLLQNRFSLPLKIYLEKKFSVNSSDDWNNYYDQFPGSAGIFEFSAIKYDEQGKTAIFYYSHRRQGLNAHGCVVVMKRTHGIWVFDYQIYLWQA